MARHKRLTAACRLTRHALGLAALAGTLVDRHGGCVEGEALVIQRLPAPEGLVVWEAGSGRALLHVDTGGCPLFYQRGAWEQRLRTLVAQDLPRHASPPQRGATHAPD